MALIHPADLFKLKFIKEACLSPDGSQVVYVIEHVEPEREVALTTIYLIELTSNVIRQLTGGTHNDLCARWSPDGKTLAFVSDRSGKPQIYLLPLAGGEALPLTSLEQGVGSSPAWSPDGKKIAFTAGPEKPPLDASKPYRVNRHLFRFDSLGLIENALQDIFTVSTVGGTPVRWTDAPYMKMNPQWSPDGMRILYQAGLKGNSFSYRTGLEIVDSSGSVQDVLGEWGWAGAAHWMPGSERICFVGVPWGAVNGTKRDLWMVNLDDSKNPECRTTHLAVGVGGSIQGDISNLELFSGDFFISPDGEYAFIQCHRGGEVGIVRVALHGEERVRWVIEGQRACAALGTDFRRLLFLAGTPQQPGDLFIADFDGRNERQLTFINAEILQTWPKPRVQPLRFQSADGKEIEAWAMLPETGQPPYPTLVYIHGGPHYAFGYMYVFDVHMLTSAGYAVLLVNFRSSTGYGSEFSTATHRDWGNLDYQDIMGGVDHAVALEISDPDRLGCFGLSFGGYMSCWIVGQTDRFKAAVPENPLTNWVSFYGVSNTEGPFFAVEELGGRPYEVREVYQRCSPITYAHLCKTPTLLIQGEADFCCPAEQSEQFYTVLKDSGCVVEMLRLPGSPHTGSIDGPPIVRRIQNEALLDWMERYVK